MPSDFFPSSPPSPICHCFEFYIAASVSYHFHATGFDPSAEVLALANVEEFQISAAFDDGFDAGAGYTYTATD